ncbi:MAG: TspO/MBR family protein [Eubacteriales bacterium]
MKKFADKIKMRISREAACINTTLVIIFAVVSAVLGVIFAIGGIDCDVYEEIIQPRFYLPPFFMVLFCLIFYALLGAAAGMILSTPYYRQNGVKAASLALFACTLILCFSWIPLIYTAKSFFIGMLIYLAVLLFSAVIFRFFFRINRIAAWLVLIFAVFALYMACYSFTLFIIN